MLKMVVISVLMLGALQAADIDACPSSIDVKPQQLASTVPGWTVSSYSGKHVLWSVELYDGNPKEMADLIPDGNNRQKRVWNFKDPASTFWVQCHYTRTTIVLERPLPRTVKSCVLTFEQGSSLDGENVIKQMMCR